MHSAMYPGSFDPLTFGHLDIITRASDMFDEVIVGVLDNYRKIPLFSVEERVNILKEATKDMKNIKVEAFSGLIVDFARQKNCNIAIRGLRAISDYEYELQMAQTNRLLSKGSLDTIFLTTSLEYSYISSSGVKEIAYFNGDVSKCVPEFVAELIYEKYRQQKR
ncbi:MAG: pantetheine-phosphate adenylyltransferase [Lachnospiraceae bacterium]|nr:pantetheine-phosphate adenylyltransferase [Lachnospiraceae bacterium]